MLCMGLLFNTVATAQWARMQGVPADENYLFMACINDSTCILGSNRLLLRTHNTGERWDTISYETDVFFTDVQFVNDSTIYAAGYRAVSASQILKKSYDLGQSWTVLNTAVDGKIHFTSPDTGHNYQPNFVQRTTDGGITWQTTETNAPPAIGNLYFTHASTGFFAGNYPGTVFKTTNHGQNWVDLQVAGDFFDIRFASDQHGYAAGYFGEIFKTNDAGNTWTLLSTGLSNTQTLRAIFAESDVSCYAAGEHGMLIKTTDGGLTWAEEVLNTTQHLNALFCTASFCYVVGDSGTAFRTENTLTHVAVPTIFFEDSSAIYPNPVSGVFYVALPSDDRLKKLLIYNMDGRVVSSHESNTADLSNRVAGKYLIVIKGEKRRYKKVVVKY